MLKYINGVKVYQWGGTSWVQKGNTVFGDSVNQSLGKVVDLNADGSILAVSSSKYDSSGFSDHGQVQVYQWNGTFWMNKGLPFRGNINQGQLGVDIGLNNSGDRIAIGNYGGVAGKGEVRVYEWNGQSWDQLGATLVGQYLHKSFGYAISLNGDGNVLAVGTWDAPISGICSIYEWNGSNWVKKGLDISARDTADLFGYDVALNDSGNVVVIGAPAQNLNGFFAGYAQVYEWNGVSWQQKGADINGTSQSEFCGEEVSINAAGDIIAVSSPIYDGISYPNSIYIGLTRVFKWENQAWIQKGMTIFGEDSIGEAGKSLSLDSMGNTIVIGAPFNLGPNNLNSGHVRVYDIANVVGLNRNNTSSVINSIAPNPFHKEFIISFEKATTATVRIRDLQGKLIKEHQLKGKAQHTISVEGKSGIYFVEVDLNGSKEVQKVIKL